MAVCANCTRALQPEWKFCIYCGTPTGAGDSATAPIATTQDAVDETAVESAPDDEAAAEHASSVLRAEDIPADDDPESALAATATSDPLPRVNILAVLALILGCLISPLAALFGHLALTQISRSGERGTAIAWVAIVLGYLSLAALLVLGISYLVLNA
ncbi:MAG TPA: DUF4190 domain-containing protein [Pseudolysinimonas sp.]